VLRTFYYFNPWSSWVFHSRALLADHEGMAAALATMDAELGCAGRRWVVDASVRWLDGFMLTGAVLPLACGLHRVVWRLTIDLPLPGGGTDARALAAHGNSSPGWLNLSGVAFHDGEAEMRVCSLLFESGAVSDSDHGGLWVTQDVAAARVLPGVDVECGGHRTPWPPGRAPGKTDDSGGLRKFSGAVEQRARTAMRAQS
jgi:hypothetical protein